MITQQFKANYTNELCDSWPSKSVCSNPVVLVAESHNLKLQPAGVYDQRRCLEAALKTCLNLVRLEGELEAAL